MKSTATAIIYLLTLLRWTSETSAWIAARQPSHASTQLAMFDWFKPKTKGDVFSNIFNGSEPQDVSSDAEKHLAENQDAKKVSFQEGTLPIESEVLTVSSTASGTSADSNQVNVESDIHTGSVAWYSRIKGYGFIQLDNGTKDNQVFVHQSEIQAEGFRMLYRGESVELQLEDDGKGRNRAVQVTGPNGGDLRIQALRRNEQA